MFNILQMELQSVNIQRKACIFRKLSTTDQSRKRYTNNFKVNNTSKSSKNPQVKSAQGCNNPRNLEISTKPLRRFSNEFQATYATVKAPKIGDNDHLLSTNQHIEALHQFHQSNTI